MQNRIAYGMAPDDASFLANYMAPMTPAEICNLSSYRIAVKLRDAGERGMPACTLVTLPPENNAEGNNSLMPLLPGTPSGPLHGRVPLSGDTDGSEGGLYRLGTARRTRKAPVGNMQGRCFPVRTPSGEGTADQEAAFCPV